MTISKEQVRAMLDAAAHVLGENTDRLSEIDSRFGDGDHGITIGKISKLILERTAAWESEGVKEFLDALGSGIMGVNGGSAGPLYGTMIGGLGEALGDDLSEISASELKGMFASSLAAMGEITKAKEGDKTMMDALIPAVAAAQTAEDDAKSILNAAAAAAEQGAKTSENFASKFGRARSYKEQTIGTPDAGAVSTALFLRGLASGL